MFSYHLRGYNSVGECVFCKDEAVGSNPSTSMLKLDIGFSLMRKHDVQQLMSSIFRKATWALKSRNCEMAM